MGVTSDLKKRVYEHRNKLASGFTSTYNVFDLVYYEWTSEIESAIKREKRIKKWNRAWKIKLIQSMNPEWNDLYDAI